MKKIVLGCLFICLLTSLAVVAQSRTSSAATQATTRTPTPSQLITIPMADGLEVKGDFYAASESEPAPAILLLHQLNASGASWRPLALPLSERGYNVLAVDMRGQGITGGQQDWELAESDAAALMDWLRDQPTVDPERVAVAGASIGANLALRTCAADERCHAVIALSAGLNYFGVVTLDSIKEMEDKAVLLAASQLDTQSAGPTKTLTVNSSDSVNITTRIYGASRAHGTALFGFDDLIPLLLEWLDNYNH